MNPWDDKEIAWAIPPRDAHGGRLIGPSERHVAKFNPGEMTIMTIARERGATSQDLEAVHVVKAVFEAEFPDTPTFIFDAEARA